MLRGKNAVVTGSTGTIGRAIAEALADAGANILVNGFGSTADTEALRTSLARRSGGQAIYHGADMLLPDEVADMIEIAEKRFGGIDILVNNAGIQHVSSIEDFPTEKWDEILAVNLSAAFHAIRCSLMGMKARGWGRIVSIASVHGLVASADKSAYVAAKHGLVGLTKAVALETAALGITCNAICPGFVDTTLIRDQVELRAKQSRSSMEDARSALLREKQPSLAFVSPEQIGKTVLFLCSPAAAAITGTAIPVDGGWVAQ